MMRLLGHDGAALRVLQAVLNVTNVEEKLDFDRIALEARTTERFVRTTLSRALGPDSPEIRLSPERRVRLAMEIARAGPLGDAAKALTWQEFEKFAEECLLEAGFQTEKNVRVKGEDRTWQIDVVGSRGELVLAIDCKHWNTPGYLSKFKRAAEHQRASTRHFLARQVERTSQRDMERQALPMILTLSEPRSRFSEGVVLVSVEKLPSFLSGVAPYDENLPFISSSAAVVENPMSEPK